MIAKTITVSLALIVAVILFTAGTMQKPVLVFKDKTHHIEIYERMFDGVQHYLELENKKKNYVIICELNVHRNVFIMKNKSQTMGYSSSYYDVADTGKGIATSLSGEVHGPLEKYDRNYIKPDKLEMQLLQTAISRVDPGYKLQVRKIKFFMSLDPMKNGK